MARYTGPVCRLCRREGESLSPRGGRCYTDKCAVSSLRPRSAWTGQEKVSEYGTQLREKQKLRKDVRHDGVTFSKYFVIADKQKGITGEKSSLIVGV